METIKLHDQGPAVTDIQQRLVKLGYLSESETTGVYDEDTAAAVAAFATSIGMSGIDEVDQKVWARLVDASYDLGDRVLFLRIPYFHGNDVKVLQQALSALGFSTGNMDGIFGAHTEDALRKFQMNMALPADGIAGALTYRCLSNLQHSWKDKERFSPIPHMGFARAAEVLETNLICLFGTTDFTRSVAARMSNLALATSPASKITSADSLLVTPEESMRFVQIIAGDASPEGIPVVDFEPEDALALRLKQAFKAASGEHARIAIRLPGETWEDAGEARSAQHFAIVLLDAICAALAMI